MALQAAGFKGPFWPTEHTYSIGCLVSWGAGVKPAAFVGSDITIGQAPKVLNYFGMAADTAASVGEALGDIFGWPAAVIGAPFGISELAKKCECTNGN
jgi:hypothetical protein